VYFNVAEIVGRCVCFWVVDSLFTHYEMTKIIQVAATA